MNLLFNNSAIDLGTLALLIISFIIILLLSVYLIYSFFKKKKSNNDSKNLEDLKNEYKEKISNISQMSEEKINELILSEYELFINKETRNKIRELKNEKKEEINKISSKILIDSMESIVSEYIEKTEDVIPVPEDLIGRFIGKDGINIKLIERLTSCQPYVVKNENCLRISSFNSIKKEIAVRLIKKLISLKSFDRNRIEKNYELVLEEFDAECIKIGEKIVDELSLGNMDDTLKKYIGRLSFRTSFKQNVLKHSIECALISKNIAKYLNLDEELAMKCSFYHDIGKSIDFEENGDHVKSGVKIAKKYNLCDEIINAIESHHDDKNEKYIYSKITKLADKISASKPGARNNNEQITIERIEELEQICNSFKEVSKSYVVRSGKEIIVILDTKKTNDKNYKMIGRKIKKKIKENSKTNY